MTSYNSSQNEVTEQCFHTLFERTYAILTSVNLSIWLWDEAIMTVIYLKNRSSITALNNITLYETWHDKKSDLSYLHTFECIVYLKAHWKLNDKSLKCQFLSYERVNQFRLWNEKNVLISSHVQWDEIVIEVEKYEDLLILSFDDQINDSSFLIKITENAKIMKIVNDHQTRTSITSQKASRSRSLELESSESDSSNDSDAFDAFDASDASSECFKRVIAESVDYKALNNFWVKDHNWDFISKANRVQIELNTSQTVKHAKASFDWKQWKLAFRSELDTHIKNDIFILKISSLNSWILPTR